MSWGVISRMGHVVIQTPNVEEAVSDTAALLGAHPVERTGESVRLASSEQGRPELAYLEGTANGIHALGLVASDGDALREVRRRAEEQNLRIIQDGVAGLDTDASVSFYGPEGWRFDVYLDAADQPLGRGGGPQRFGHVNFHPQNVRAMADFLTTVLDFRTSDQIGDSAYFLRCNTEHHGIALIQGAGHFHHHAWQMKSTEQIVDLCDRLHAAGRDVIWGPVRHGAGQNIAAYCVESTGAVVEVYTDMEHIYDADRPPVLWDAEDNWYNLWSDHRPLDFRSLGIPSITRGDARG